MLFTHGFIVNAGAREYDGRTAVHSQGNIQLRTGNGGGFVTSIIEINDQTLIDPITGDRVNLCIYPRGSDIMYLRGELHFGATIDGDTLVSNAWETGPPEPPFGAFGIMSSDKSSSHFSESARSDLDLTCVHYDTNSHRSVLVGWDTRDHIPIGLEIRQYSMAWSGAAIDDFVLFEYEVRNIGHHHLIDLYVGLDCVGFARHEGESEWDDLSGLLRGYRSSDACEVYDSLNVAYVMDNDGNPVDGQWVRESPRGAVGVMLLGASQDDIQLNYNWWGRYTAADSWGPRRRGSIDDPFRQIGAGLGWAQGDANLYYVMSHPEVDYDQLFAAIDYSAEGWIMPWHLAEDIASGWLIYFLYSFGPFDIGVHEHINFTIAVVGGDNVHNDPLAYFDPNHPQEFYDQLDLSELATNARWAQWVYDNPGYDTDSDGYRGEFRICEGDTIWYKGDGVPDFRGNTPPPAPFTRFITEPGRITIRWNGYLSETSVDPFSNLVDFEGYRVYCGLDIRRASLSILSSYDRENFFRLKWHELGSGNGKWINDEPPYTLDELQTIHDDPNLDPHRYNRDHPLFEGDSVFYFQMVDANLDDLSSPLGIHKVYPNATDPGIDTTLWTEDDLTYDYGRPLPKYYEYEYVLDNLLPTVPYFVSVTSFDFGYAGGRGNLPPDESNPLNNLTECYAQTSADSVEAHNLDVYVYPNPYRVDADYHERGYENRAGRIIPDRARLLHFGNLPNVCTISIFSLDGDLIGKKNHNFPEGGPEAMHDWWNLVSRSGLAVESGLYYWVVESATRSQIGKFVIIK